jgi:hypothetical protein
LAAAQTRQSPELIPPFPPRAQVLLLGTFHFHDAGTDDYKPKFKVEVLSDARQREINLLVDALARFRPTVIAVEWPVEKQSELDAQYEKYIAGKLDSEVNEIYQLGFRLAKRLRHSRVLAIDARARWYDSDVSTELLIQRAQQNQQLELLGRGQKWDAYYNRLSESDDQLKTTMTIPDFLGYLNSPEKLRATLGRYLVGESEVGGRGDYVGADMRTAWYNRNFRIFSNIQRLPLRDNDRVLVVIGQGHVPILHHLFENAPEYRLEKLSNYLRK